MLLLVTNSSTLTFIFPTVFYRIYVYTRKQLGNIKLLKIVISEFPERVLPILSPERTKEKTKSKFGHSNYIILVYSA